MPDDDLVRVVLLGLPVPLHQRSSEHVDDLRREFELIRQSDPEAHRNSAPARLHALIDALTAAYEGVSDQPNAQIREAVARAQQSVDVVYFLPPSAADSLAQLAALLEEADMYCRSGGHLLTMAPEPDVLRYRQWFFDQCLGQLTGGAPTPWPEYRAVVRHDDDHAIRHDVAPRPAPEQHRSSAPH